MELVLNWIWQGILIACATAALLRLVARTSARLRYGLLWASLTALLVLPLVPFVAAEPATMAAFAAAPLAVAATPMVALPGPSVLVDRVVMALGGLWMLAATWRLARAGAAVRRARRRCTAFPSDTEARLQRWSALRVSGRRTRLALCGDVRSAGVLPGPEPWIALSPRLLDALADEEIDRIVVHEWAHIQRYDDGAHVLQAFVSACAGWHPAIWWCTRQLHLEREMACDELAVALTGSRRAYAACLARLATLPAPPVPPLPIVAAISASGVRRRVIRILSADAGTAGRSRVLAAAFAAAALVAAAPYVSAFRIVAAGHVPNGNADAPPSSTSGAGAARIDAAQAYDESAITAAPSSMDGRVEARRGPAAEVGARGAAAAPRVSDAGTAARARTESLSLPPQHRDSGGGAAAMPAVSAVAAREAGSQPLRARFLPAAAFEGLPIVTPAVGRQDSQSDETRTTAAAAPWDVAVAGSLAVGRGSRDAGVVTAGFFSRLGRRVAGSF